MKAHEVAKPPNGRDRITYKLARCTHRPAIIEHDGSPVY